MSTHSDYQVLGSAGLDNYKFLTASVIPRPIAWVSTFAEDGSVNVAPFSFFTVASPEPPTVIFSIGGFGNKASGEIKDTLANARRGSKVTISQVDRSVIHEMVGTAAEFDDGINEFEAVRLEQHELIDGYPSMVAGAPGALFGRTVRILEVGKSHLVMCEVDSYAFRSDLFDGRHVDYEKVDVVGRLGGPHYAGLAEVIHSPRVSVEQVMNTYRPEQK